MDAKRELELVQSVFSTEAGKELLTGWMSEFVLQPVFSKDTNTMCAMVGMQEFVQSINIKMGSNNE